MYLRRVLRWKKRELCLPLLARLLYTIIRPAAAAQHLVAAVSRAHKQSSNKYGRPRAGDSQVRWRRLHVRT